MANSRTRKPLQRTKRVHAANRRGAALIEFALTAPILGLLSVAVFDFAKIAYVRLVVADAAGAASRFAALHPMPTGSLDTWVKGIQEAALASSSGSMWIDPSRMSLQPVNVDQIPPNDIRITVQVDYQFQPKFWWPGLPSGSMVSSKVSIPGVR